MPETIPADVESLLVLMSEMTTTMPTLVDVVHACQKRLVEDAPIEVFFTPVPDVFGALASAQDLGLIDVIEDLGPEALFVLSTLAAEHLGIVPTHDSRRWMNARNGKLIGPPERRYRHPKPDLSEGEYYPLHMRVDVRQLSADKLMEIAEQRHEAAKRPYGGDAPEDAPTITRFYGLGAIWEGEEQVIPGCCPYCSGAKIGVHGYCLKCHASGMDRFLEKPKASRRRQMPKGQKLKGGV